MNVLFEQLQLTGVGPEVTPNQTQPVSPSTRMLSRLGGAATLDPKGSMDTFQDIGYRPTSTEQTIKIRAASEVTRHLEDFREICGQVDTSQRQQSPASSEIRPIDGMSKFIEFGLAVSELSEIAHDKPVAKLDKSQQSGMNRDRAEYVGKILGLEALAEILSKKGLEHDAQTVELHQRISSGRLQTHDPNTYRATDSFKLATGMLGQIKQILTSGMKVDITVLENRITELKTAAGYSENSKLDIRRTIKPARKVLSTTLPTRHLTQPADDKAAA